MSMNYQSRKYALLNSPVEVERHVRRVQRFLAPARTESVLDVGCGRGFVTRRIQEIAPATTGIDLNAEAVANGVTGGLRVMDAQQLTFADSSFDKIYSFHAIEHIPDVAAALREMERVLRPGGRIMLVYPAEPIRGLYVIPSAILLFGNPWRARDLHIHKLSPWALRPFLAGTSLRVVASRLHLLLTPQFISVLQKPAVAAPPLARRSRRAGVGA